jgi:hypothetical protein
MWTYVSNVLFLAYFSNSFVYLYRLLTEQHRFRRPWLCVTNCSINATFNLRHVFKCLLTRYVCVREPVTVAASSKSWVLAAWIAGSRVRIPPKASIFVLVHLSSVVSSVGSLALGWSLVKGVYQMTNCCVTLEIILNRSRSCGLIRTLYCYGVVSHKASHALRPLSDLLCEPACVLITPGSFTSALWLHQRHLVARQGFRKKCPWI